MQDNKNIQTKGGNNMKHKTIANLTKLGGGTDMSRYSNLGIFNRENNSPC